MRQLLFTGPRSVVWEDVPEPGLDSDLAAVVEPVAVSTCDMDAVALSGMVRFRPGTPVGHEGVGRVIDVGDDVVGVSPGDVVIIPWQISCGACDRCKRGQDTFCRAVPPGSCYGWGPHVARWGGFLADRILVPFADHMLVPVPAALDPVRACGLSDNLVDAWRAVGPPLAETGGGRVLVVGGVLSDGGSIGLYAAAFAHHLGAGDVVFVSQDAGLRAHAERLAVRAVDAADGYPDLGMFDVTVDASGLGEGLVFALRSTGPCGICTCTAGAVHRNLPVPLPVYEMYMNVVTFRTGWAHTRSLIDRPLRLVADGLFDPTAIARTHAFDDAQAAFAEPFTKLIFRHGAAVAA
jgi:threonine dehydrogenase-like Zn-dependent dehydrogenase